MADVRFGGEAKSDDELRARGVFPAPDLSVSSPSSAGGHLDPRLLIHRLGSWGPPLFSCRGHLLPQFPARPDRWRLFPLQRQGRTLPPVRIARHGAGLGRAAFFTNQVPRGFDFPWGFLRCHRRVSPKLCTVEATLGRRPGGRRHGGGARVFLGCRTPQDERPAGEESPLTLP